MTRKRGVLVPATVPFWPKPASTFGLLSVTMFIERSPGFALPSILAPLRLMLADTSFPHGFDASPWAVGALSGGAVQVVTFLHISVGYR
jgi:hypothetical protein